MSARNAVPSEHRRDCVETPVQAGRHQNAWEAPYQDLRPVKEGERTQTLTALCRSGTVQGGDEFEQLGACHAGAVQHVLACAIDAVSSEDVLRPIDVWQATEILLRKESFYFERAPQPLPS